MHPPQGHPPPSTSPLTWLVAPGAWLAPSPMVALLSSRRGATPMWALLLTGPCAALMLALCPSTAGPARDGDGAGGG